MKRSLSLLVLILCLGLTLHAQTTDTTVTPRKRPDQKPLYQQWKQQQREKKHYL